MAGSGLLSGQGSSSLAVSPAALLRAQVLSAALSVCGEGKGGLFCSQSLGESGKQLLWRFLPAHMHTHARVEQ